MADDLTSLRDRIAGILHLHTLAEDDPVFWRCCCTAYSDSFKDDYMCHAAHVADAVIAELGLAQEYAYTRHPRRRAADYRYVTAWRSDE